MFRSAMPDPEQRAAERLQRIARQGITCMPRRAATMEGGTSGTEMRKPEPWRCAALIEMARGRPCLFHIPGVCNHKPDTTVACHENMGKGMATKQSDERSVWGCSACHTWYDQSPAPREQKRATFMRAHADQVLAWRQVAADPAEPARFRRAAAAALERLGATP